MKGLFSLFVFIVISAIAANAQQSYIFESSPISYPQIKDCPQNDLLSLELSIKLEQFNQLYSKKVSTGAPDFQTSIEIIKPDLYYSVQKLSKYFSKCLKKGTLQKDQAENEFRTILEKCLQIAQRDTSPIEAELRTTSNPAEIVCIFDKIVIKN
ncbi:MAG: hypothetical protein ACK5JD_04870 [Mangrovibacterium sp.]